MLERPDLTWFHSTSKHCLFKPKNKKGSYQLYNNNAIYVQYWALQHLEDVLFSRSWWSQWGSNPIHIKHPNTKSMPIHAFMWPQWCYINGCHICTNNMKSQFLHIDGFWCSSHHCSFSMDHYESTNCWKFGWVVETPKCKDVITWPIGDFFVYYWQCFIRIKNITWITTLLYIFTVCCIWKN